MNKNNQKSDVLLEASRMLSEPGRDTRRKILIAVNSVFIASLLLFLIIQLINFGTLPDPARDMVFYPILIIINSISLIYNSAVLRGKKQGSRRRDSWTAWSSVIVAMVLALLIVHANTNTATSMLVDFGFSVVVLFVVGTVLGRKVAVIWFFISAASLFLAYYNVGTTFEYHLLTQEEVDAFNTALEQGNPEAQDRLALLTEKQLMPLPAALYVSVWLIFMLIAFLAVFFESNMISKVLGVIPGVIEKINIANEEKAELENENMRMGMELDVARRIQLMMLPTDKSFNKHKELEVAARMDPASEVGGDFYEFLPQEDGSVIMAMGDVTDHGLQSGLVMLMAQSTIRSIVDEQPAALKEALSRTNKILYRNIRNRMNDFRNLTLLLARIKGEEMTVCGQHENILFYNGESKETKVISTEDMGIYIGLVEDVTEHLHEKTFPIKSGDIYLFYTDGLTEAENGQGEFYGEGRLQNTFSKLAKYEPEQIVEGLYNDVYQFIGNESLMDDITVLVIKKRT